MKNPFKFGSLVDAPYFTDRVKELQYIKQFLNSENHLILISPRRFGKSSLVKKVSIVGLFSEASSKYFRDLWLVIR